MNAEQIARVLRGDDRVIIAKHSKGFTTEDIVKAINQEAHLIVTDKDKVITEALDTLVSVDFKDFTDEGWSIENDTIILDAMMYNESNRNIEVNQWTVRGYIASL